MSGTTRMQLFRVIFLVSVPATSTLTSAPTQAQATSCAVYDSEIWAQSVFATNPAGFAALDPDGNGVACEELPLGAAPALWTDAIPIGAVPATLSSVTDGDTIRVFVEGRNEPVRLILIDTPETRAPSTPVQCFGPEATAYLRWLLSLGGQLSLEIDVTNRDRYERLLRYVWLDLDGEVYLVNEVMARSGYASLSTYPPDVRYVDQIREAAAFAREHGYGLWSECGAGSAAATDEQSFVPRELEKPAWTLPGAPVPPSDGMPCVGIPYIAIDSTTQRLTIAYANGDTYFMDESPCPPLNPAPRFIPEDCAALPEPDASECFDAIDSLDDFGPEIELDPPIEYPDPFEGQRDPDYRSGP